MNISENICANIAGVSWSLSEVLEAIRGVDTTTPHSVCSIGTRGSMHFFQWSEPSESAESSVQKKYGTCLANNPAVGDIDTSIRPETSEEKCKRIQQAVLEILNS